MTFLVLLDLQWYIAALGDFPYVTVQSCKVDSSLIYNQMLEAGVTGGILP